MKAYLFTFLISQLFCFMFEKGVFCVDHELRPKK